MKFTPNVKVVFQNISDGFSCKNFVIVVINTGNEDHSGIKSSMSFDSELDFTEIIEIYLDKIEKFKITSSESRWKLIASELNVKDLKNGYSNIAEYYSIEMLKFVLKGYTIKQLQREFDDTFGHWKSDW